MSRRRHHARFVFGSNCFPLLKGKRVLTHHVKARATAHFVLSTVRLQNWTWFRRVPISSVCRRSWLDEVGFKRVSARSCCLAHLFVQPPCYVSSTLPSLNQSNLLQLGRADKLALSSLPAILTHVALYVAQMCKLVIPSLIHIFCSGTQPVFRCFVSENFVSSR